MHTLESIEGGFTFFLDEGWGEGKTVFSRQVEICLRELNPITENADIGSEIGKLLKIEDDSILHSYLPVYYSAWENDYWDDPLPSLGSAIAATGSAHFSTRTDLETGEVVVTALDAVLQSMQFNNLPNIGGLSEIRKTLAGSELIEGYRNRGQLRQNVNALIDASLPEHANKMLLIIDELDRCRPTFALKALEEIKNLFTSDKLIILCSVNIDQLAKTVEGIYGPGTDGDGYLERFYDAKVCLSPISKTAFMSYKGLRTTSYYFDSISTEVLSELAPPLRTLGKTIEELEAKRELALNTSSNEPIINFALGCLVPTLIILKHCQPLEYRNLKSNGDAATVTTLISSSKTASAFFDYLYGQLELERAIKRKENSEPQAAVYELQKHGIIEGMVARMIANKEPEWPEGCEDINHRYWIEKESWHYLRSLVEQ